VVAANEEAGPVEAAHLVREEQAGAVVSPVRVIQVAGDDDERHIARDGEVHQVGKSPAGAVLDDVLWDAATAGQAGQRAVQVDIGGVEEFHDREA
jgi:hypothetical protein